MGEVMCSSASRINDASPGIRSAHMWTSVPNTVRAHAKLLEVICAIQNIIFLIHVQVFVFYSWRIIIITSDFDFHVVIINCCWLIRTLPKIFLSLHHCRFWLFRWFAFMIICQCRVLTVAVPYLQPCFLWLQFISIAETVKLSKCLQYEKRTSSKFKRKLSTAISFGVGWSIHMQSSLLVHVWKL